MGTITGIQKDQTGYVWISTAEGLHRFDGKNFKVYKHIDGQDNSLSDSYIRSILHQDGDLYIGNNSGTVDIMDLADYSISKLDPRRIDPGFDFPISTLSYYKGTILIGTQGGGLWTYDPLAQQLKKFHAPEIDDLSITDIEIHRGLIYFSAASVIYSCDLIQCKPEQQWENGEISTFTFYRDQLYIGGSQGFQRRETSGRLVDMPVPYRKRRVTSISDLQVAEDELWVATAGGLVRHGANGMSHYMHNDIRPYTLVNDKINCLYFDTDLSLWIGTISGLSRYSSRLKKFGLKQYFDFQGKGYNNNVYTIYQDGEQGTWVGTLTGGLLLLNRDHEIVEVYPIIKDGKAETRSVRAVFRDSKNRLWIGTRDEGLFLMNESNGTFKNIRGPAGADLPNPVVRAIYEDRKGRIWIGTQSGLSRYDADEQRFYTYQAEPSSKTNNTIYQITEDPKTGQLVLASFRGGIQLFNPRSAHFLSLKYHPEDSTSLSNNNVMCMAWINQDSLLVGTYGGGMNILDMRSKQATHVTESNGLPNNAVYGILYEGKGKAWLSTNNGLVQYDIYNTTFSHFKPIHYLQNTEFNEGAFSKSQDGMFYFGGVSGINFFHPEQINYDTIRPPLLITDMRGEFKSTSDQRIKLSFLNSRLELDFMALHYVNPEGVRYSYKMEGYDQNWIVPTVSNTAIYPRLSPGSYTFKVLASDEFGQWEVQSADLRVVVQPPFWQRWWFIVLVLLAVAGGILAWLRYRTKEIERSYRLQMVDSELRALRSQMNPHFIFNSLNSIQYFILKKQPQEAYTYLSKFASLMRKILQNSRLKYISIKDETEWLDLYLEMEKMRMDEMLVYTIDTSGIPDIDHTYIPTMLIQPYVENSIVHGLLPKEEDKQIVVSFEKRSDHLVCTVEDNGIGRDASRVMNAKRTKQHKSAGMALTKSRLRILSEGKGDFDVVIEDLYQAGKASGTRVIIQIPLIDNVDD